ncbi:hypothetical protein [Kiloniella sp. b19]|uniref:hypothetical protein n=1 Tax=Kiloniella sp. GXU_MW_B19 TaxID=3141326 RepID=UPI0031DC5143
MTLSELAEFLYHSTSAGQTIWTPTVSAGIFSLNYGDFIVQSGLEIMSPRPRYYMRLFDKSGKMLHQLLDEPKQLQLMEAGKLYEAVKRAHEKSKDPNYKPVQLSENPVQRDKTKAGDRHYFGKEK